jgi:N-methylhydantoinase A
MSTMVIPPGPGVFSSFGLLWSPLEHHYSRPFRRGFSDVRRTDLLEAFESLAETAYSELGDEGASRQSIDVEFSADMHYIGQNAEITIRLPEWHERDLASIREVFELEHETQYGYRSRGESLQFTNLRLVARAAVPLQNERAHIIESNSEARQQADSRDVYFGPDHGWLSTPVIARGDLDNNYRHGPLAIEEYDSTTIVPPGCHAKRDRLGNIIVNLNDRE